jgi:hypothetical protein
MRLLALAALAIGLTACTAQVSTAPVVVPPASSTLIVDWTINGTNDPNQCFQSSAAAIQVSVTASGGVPAGTFQQSCTAFATSITLSAGSYIADAVLLDPSGTPRTTSVPINPFTLNGGDTLSIPIDFPASSFF